MATRPQTATILRRYTDLPSAFDVLKNRRLTLLSPSTWEDRNDRASMQRYADAESHRSVLGLCFSQAAETFHHWKVFAPNSSGVCIEFWKEELLAQIPQRSAGYRHGKVTYKRPAEFMSSYATAWDLPFIKGWAYRHEIEYRIIHTAEAAGPHAITFPIRLKAIRSIVLSPWLPSALVHATQAALNSTRGCRTIPVVSSSVVQNEAWIAYVNRGA